MIKIEDLKRINLLRDLPRDSLKIIADRAQMSILGTDTSLFEANEDIDTLYMLTMGQVALKIELRPGIDVILENLQSGSSFGLSSLVSDEKTLTSAVCQEPSELISLSRRNMEDLFRENKYLGFQMMLRLARQYKHGRDRYAGMIFKTETNLS